MRTWMLLLLLLGCGGSEPAVNADLAGNPDAGKAFGAVCTVNEECITGTCFIGSMQSFCTMPCTAGTQAADCPNPPTSGTCNMRGYCKP